MSVPKYRIAPLTIALFAAASVSAETARAGVVVRHLIGPDASATQLLTGGICRHIALWDGRWTCTLRPSGGIEGSRVEVESIGTFDERSYDDYQRIEAGKSRGVLRDLFERRNFRTASANLSVNAFFGSSQLTLTPGRLAMAYLINNPVLPEVHYAADLDTVVSYLQFFRVNTGQIIEDAPASRLLVGVQPMFIAGKRGVMDADISDALVGRIKPRVTRGNRSDGNVFLRWIPGSTWLTGVSLQARNIIGVEGCRGCATDGLDIDQSSRRSVSMSFDTAWRFPVGSLIAGMGLRSADALDPGMVIAQPIAMAVYKLSNIALMASTDQTFARAGFLYEGSIFKSGLFYSDEKQVDALRVERRTETYLVVGFSL